ncbi:MAG: hypothetical protein MMC23_001462 [Stictis urceolatum]|nr:hypothetical protein [Stictis urceolata]
MANPIVPTNHLPSFQKLNFQTFYDSASGTSPDPSAPALVVFCSWMNAAPRNIAKFMLHYRKLYPSTPILLLTSRAADFIYVTDAKHVRLCAPAVSTIRSVLSARGVGAGVLLHSFSNGGTGQLTFLSRAYYETTGQTIPAKAAILDSAPGLAAMGPGLRSFTVGLPEAWYIIWPLKAIFALLIVVLYSVPTFLGMKSLDVRMRDMVNSTEPEFLPKRAKRVYVFSDADDSIPMDHVLSHAEEARGKGIGVQTEVWKGTGHVEHMRKDPERYWGIVKGAWEEGMRS